MKYMTLILVFSLFACGSTKKKELTQKETLAFFSKGACLGKCPVYDMTIYTDGTYRYVGVAKVKAKGERLGKFSENQQEDLKSLLKSDLTSADEFKRIRDKPVTVLKYGKETHRFYATKTTKNRAALNAWLSDFVSEIE